MTDENPWISVDDEMPFINEEVLIKDKMGEFFVAHVCANIKKFEINCYCQGCYVQDVTHWKRIVGPSKPTSPMMVEAPNKYNMRIESEDPKNLGIGACRISGEKIYWWNNKKDHRLWYWHNDQWNRAI